MWQVACIGIGPSARFRRVVDKGPFFASKAAAERAAAWLASTRLYERVTVEKLTDKARGSRSAFRS